MAKVITTELQHSGASGANITLDSSKNVTCENNLTVDGTTTLTGAVELPDDTVDIADLSASGTASNSTYLRGDNTWAAISTTDTLSFRNIIINGAFQVWQRGTSSNLVGFRTADRWKTTFQGTHEDPTRSKLALTSSDTGPWAAGFRNAYRVTNGNQTSVEAGDNIKIEYAVEDQDLACSGWQAESTSSYLTMSFWLRSSVAQTYYVILESKHGTSKQYSFAATISSANTWTKITKTIPGHADISFGNDNGEGMDIYICPFVGTNESTSGHTLNSWKNTNGSDQVPDMTNTWYDTNDATFDLTGVQLEVGDTATDFEHRSYADELRRCHRYYWGITQNFYAYQYNSGNKMGDIYHPQPMRATPTETLTVGDGSFTHYNETIYKFMAYASSSTSDVSAKYWTKVEFDAEL